MPSRILRDGILTSEPVNALSCQAEVFYRRLISVIDDYGRYYAKPGLLRAACYPLQLDKITDTDIVKALAEVCNTSPALVLVYETAGKQFLQVLNFRQKVRAKTSKFPEPPVAHMPCTCPADAPQVLADAHLGGGGGGDVFEDEGEGGGGRNQPVSTSAACPHEKLIDLYHSSLPMGRQVKKGLWNGTRAKHLQARWREDRQRQTIEWWEEFFEHCAKSTFLTGRAQPRPGRTPFEISLDWIVEPGNFVKIIEGAYDG